MAHLLRDVIILLVEEMLDLCFIHCGSPIKTLWEANRSRVPSVAWILAGLRLVNEDLQRVRAGVRSLGDIVSWRELGLQELPWGVFREFPLLDVSLEFPILLFPAQQNS